MAENNYFATPLPDKNHWHETPEGYRIYTDVPICRTGSQLYRGRELKRHRDYNPAWNLSDNEMYEVHRSLAEVTHPDSIKSFEGKSITDDHPPDTMLFDFSDRDLTKGHMQHVRVGAPLPDGNTPLVADMHVQDQSLNNLIDSGKRHISTGYTFSLHRDPDGSFSMREIRGNHAAVVSRGRAGKDISIGDSFPVLSKGRTMLKDLRVTLIKLLAANDASDEDIDKVVSLFDRDRVADMPAAEEPKEEKPEPKDDAAKDEQPDIMAMLQDICARLDKLEAPPAEATAEDAAPADDDDEEDMDKSDAIGDSASFLAQIKPLVAASKDDKLKVAYRKQLKGAAANDHLAVFANSMATPAIDFAVDEPKVAASPIDYFNGKSYAEGLAAYQAAQQK